MFQMRIEYLESTGTTSSWIVATTPAKTLDSVIAIILFG